MKAKIEKYKLKNLIKDRLFDLQERVDVNLKKLAEKSEHSSILQIRMEAVEALEGYMEKLSFMEFLLDASSSEEDIEISLEDAEILTD